MIFNGNGYSEEWHAEAGKRGLPNNKTSIEALPALQAPEVVKVFDKYNVLSPRELKSRYEIQLEIYVKTVLVEANLVKKLGKGSILPAALRYQKELADGIVSAKAAGLATSTTLAQSVTSLIGDLEKGLATLESATAHGADGLLEEAKHLRDQVLPAMLSVRAAADALENVVADDLWPLPTYQEMLYIR